MLRLIIETQLRTICNATASVIRAVARTIIFAFLTAIMDDFNAILGYTIINAIQTKIAIRAAPCITVSPVSNFPKFVSRVLRPGAVEATEGINEIAVKRIKLDMITRHLR